MMTRFDSYEPLVPPSAVVDDGGITAFDERVEVTDSNFARGRPRFLNCTTFAVLGAACSVGIGLPTVKVRGRLPMEMLPSRPEGLGISAYQEQNDSLPVRMTLVRLSINNMDRVRRSFPLANRHFAT
jgi:hypothetical protein